MEADELDAAFQALEEKIFHYSRTWWIGPGSAARQFLDQHPEVRPRLNARLLSGQTVSTADVYTIDSLRNWHAARAELHREILDGLDADDAAALEHSAHYARHSEVSSVAAPGGESEQGDVYFVLGLPGSGKTKVLRRIAAAHAASPHIPASDADEVRARFGEYADGLGSGVVQLETVVVTYGEFHLTGEGRQDRVLARGGHAIVDVIGDPTFLPPTVELLARAGRKCYLLLTNCPVEVCKDRAKRRALETGRLVPLELIESKNGVPRAALDAALRTNLVAGWAIVDTTRAVPQVVGGDGTFDGFLDEFTLGR